MDYSCVVSDLVLCVIAEPLVQEVRDGVEAAGPAPCRVERIGWQEESSLLSTDASVESLFIEEYAANHVAREQGLLPCALSYGGWAA